MDSLLGDQMAGMKTKIRVITTFARISASTPYISEERVLAYKGSIPPGRVALLNYLVRHADCLLFHTLPSQSGLAAEVIACVCACMRHLNYLHLTHLLAFSTEGYMHGPGGFLS